MEFSAADRAALRRGVDPWEVRGFYDLVRAYPDIHPNMLALAAPLVAEVRESDTRPLGMAMKGIIKERQLRRVLAARDREDLVHQLRRVVRILKRHCNHKELVETVAYWGDARRRRVAADYFGMEAADGD